MTRGTVDLTNTVALSSNRLGIHSGVRILKLTEVLDTASSLDIVDATQVQYL